MKQTAVLKNLRIIQVPITQCLYTVPAATNLSFGTYVPIAEQMRKQGELTSFSEKTTFGETLKNEEPAQAEQDASRLLALAGTLKWDDISIPNDSVNAALQAEIRVKDTGAPKETQGVSPLLALVGTLECDATDIGERHDDYIGAGLAAELRGDTDE